MSGSIYIGFPTSISMFTMLYVPPFSNQQKVLASLYEKKNPTIRTCYGIKISIYKKTNVFMIHNLFIQFQVDLITSELCLYFILVKES